MDDLTEFLAAIWGAPTEGFGEIRSIKDGKVKQAFFDLSDGSLLGARAEVVARDSSGWDVYYGVLPRTEQAGTAAVARDKVKVLWADIDGKVFADDLRVGKILARDSLSLFPIAPQIVIDSGGGYHAYWLLSQEAPYVLARKVMEAIADIIRGDKVQDAARVLRVPWTFNKKRPEHTLSRILKYDLTSHVRITDLEQYIPDIPNGKPLRRPLVTDPLKPLFVGDLPEWLQDLIQNGAPHGQRSEMCFKVVIWLIRFGFSREAIESVFAEEVFGIGEKYRERGPKWFDYTYEAALREA